MKLDNSRAAQRKADTVWRSSLEDLYELGVRRGMYLGPFKAMLDWFSVRNEKYCNNPYSYDHYYKKKLDEVMLIAQGILDE